MPSPFFPLLFANLLGGHVEIRNVMIKIYSLIHCYCCIYNCKFTDDHRYINKQYLYSSRPLLIFKTLDIILQIITKGKGVVIFMSRYISPNETKTNLKNEFKIIS